MADNTARARQQLSGQRRAVAEHVDKWRRYPDQNDKNFAIKTIERAQREIDSLKAKHPTLKNDTSWEDSWTQRSG